MDLSSEGTKSIILSLSVKNLVVYKLINIKLSNALIFTKFEKILE